MATLVELKARAKKMGYKGYSKMKKGELEKLLTTPPPKPPRTKPVSQRVPIKQVEPAKKASTPKKAPTADTISGTNILYRSEFYDKEDWKKRRFWESLKARDFKKGTIKDASAQINIYKNEEALYFIKNQTPIKIQQNEGEELFEPIKDLAGGERVRKAYERGRLSVAKLTDKQIKDYISKGEGKKSVRMAMMIYLHSPQVLKEKHPQFGVYRGVDNPRNPNDTPRPFYGVFYPDITAYEKRYIYRIAKAGEFVRDMIVTTYY